eukprot:TRINITY_DN5584_c0_g1_i2.p1 TRINITY_DN5584_c0_g1~~TRINITY_DN5584_c0_g1_i2.p1  ORF type:complete len:147 (-),score=42.39 TRINITY_DN5584_c0_g1_i2:194-634(-)
MQSKRSNKNEKIFVYLGKIFREAGGVMKEEDILQFTARFASSQLILESLEYLEDNGSLQSNIHNCEGIGCSHKYYWLSRLFLSEEECNERRALLNELNDIMNNEDHIIRALEEYERINAQIEAIENGREAEELPSLLSMEIKKSFN